jgi:acetyl coenzyme A synthetase (ADP forming)-like protein
MEALFKPRSVAVVGASANSTKLGYKVLNNIISCGFNGKIYPVTPKSGEILGLQTVSSLLEIEDEVDFVAVVVRADRVLSVVEDAVKKGVKCMEIITSGFREIGNWDMENDLVHEAKKSGLRIIGPNMFGIYSRASSLNATFSSKSVLPGNVAVITQSGAIGVAMIGKTEVQNIGLSAIISLGNKADINEADIVQYLEKDEYTKSILLYIEGIKGGERVLNNLKKVAKKKPTIVLKAGASKRGAMAVASHTGSLAGSDKLFSDIMRQSGVIRASTMNEAINWSQFLSNTPMPKGFNTLIITNGGGLGALATDSAEKSKIELLDDPEHLSDKYSTAIKCYGSARNPIDITGEANREIYQQILRKAFEDDKVDAIIVLGTEVAVFSAEEIEEMITEEFERGFSKPVVFSFVGGKEMESRVVEMRKRGIPIYSDIDQAISPLGAMFRFYKNILRDKDTVYRPQIAVEEICRVVEKAKAEGRKTLLQTEGIEILNHLKISNPESYLAKDEDEAVRFAQRIGYPVVMKIVSKDILHKSDAGGVFVGVKTSDEVRWKFSKILLNAKSFNRDAEIRGVEIVEMVKPSTEAIIGIRRDPQFGTIVMAGVGGVYVEVFHDVSFRSYPLSRQEVIRMFKSTKLYTLLSGVRGERPRDMEALIDVVLKLGETVESCPKISDIEINPLFLYEDEVKAVDIRIILGE